MQPSYNSISFLCVKWDIHNPLNIHRILIGAANLSPESWWQHFVKFVKCEIIHKCRWVVFVPTRQNKILGKWGLFPERWFSSFFYRIGDERGKDKCTGFSSALTVASCNNVCAYTVKYWRSAHVWMGAHPVGLWGFVFAKKPASAHSPIRESY